VRLRQRTPLVYPFRFTRRCIRRLDLDIGKSESVSAIWIKFHDLEIQPLSQRYTRIGTNMYRYESDTGFSAEIVVDDLGLVITYPGGWDQIGLL